MSEELAEELGPLLYRRLRNHERFALREQFFDLRIAERC